MQGDKEREKEKLSMSKKIRKLTIKEDGKKFQFETILSLKFTYFYLEKVHPEFQNR